ncbi:MAG: hypothetical protein HY292_00930 [Planctomycetes bacterium]|nr:hypothetical protein [Planctomycetota bacterium]
MNGAALRPLSIGEILDGAFTIYRRNFVLLFVTAAVLFAPTFAVRLVNSQFVYFAVSPLEALAIVALIWQTSELMLGRRATFGSALRVSLQKLPLAMVASAVSFALTFAGYCAFIVPGLLITARYSTVMAVVTLEPRSLRFLKRAGVLSSGFRRKALVVTLIGGLICWLPPSAINVGSRFYMTAHAVRFTVGLRCKWIVIQWLMYSTVIPYLEAVVTTLYYDLRTRKEGLDVQLAADAVLDVGTMPG